MYGETLEYGFLSDSRFGDLVFVQNGKNIQSFKAQKLRIICRIVKYFKKNPGIIITIIDYPVNALKILDTSDDICFSYAT